MANLNASMAEDVVQISMLDCVMAQIVFAMVDVLLLTSEAALLYFSITGWLQRQASGLPCFG